MRVGAAMGRPYTHTVGQPSPFGTRLGEHSSVQREATRPVRIAVGKGVAEMGPNRSKGQHRA